MPSGELFEMKRSDDPQQLPPWKGEQLRTGFINTEVPASMELHRSSVTYFQNCRGSCHLAGNHGSRSPGVFACSMQLHWVSCLFTQILGRAKLVCLF
jgi:hypothetical protein